MAVKTDSLSSLLDAAYKDDGIDPSSILGDQGSLTSGNLGLDYALGAGWPFGRTVELYGPSQSGKTSLAVAAAAAAQRIGERSMYIDFEQALDEPYMQSLGLDTSRTDVDNDPGAFIPYPASTLEAGFKAAIRFASTGLVRVFVFDSVPAMIPASAVEEGKVTEEQRTLAMERARLIGGFLGKLNPILARNRAIAFFVNHEREQIQMAGARPGMPPKKVTAGGTALTYYSSTRCRVESIKQFKSKVTDPLTGDVIDRPHSILSKITVTKNKVAPPFRVAHVYIELGVGFSNVFSALSVLIAAGEVKKNGAFLRFPEPLYHGQMSPNRNGDGGGQLQGSQLVLDVARMDPEWGERLCVRARAILAEFNAAETEIAPNIDEDGEDPGVPVEEADDDTTVAVPAFTPRRASPPAGPDLSGALNLTAGAQSSG